MTTYFYFASTFIGLLVISNVVAVKPVILLGKPVPAAVFAYAVTFVINDVITEVWGPDWTLRLIRAGFFTSIVVALFIQLAIVVPPADWWGDQDAFRGLLGQNVRIVIASMAAYLISQLHDVWAFEFWRRVTKGRHLWLRNNASTVVSQFIDTLIFITLAFYGAWGGWDVIWSAAVGQFLIKWIIAIVDTPFVYLAVWVVRSRIGITSSRA